MARKVLFAMFAMAVTFSLATAEEFMAVIRKVEDGKVTFTKGFGFGKKKADGEEGKKAEEQTLPTAAKVKVLNAKFNEDKQIVAGDALEGGLQNERFKNLGQKKGDGEGKGKGKGGFGFGFMQLLFVYIVWQCARGGVKATDRVWEGAKGLEWTVPSPAPHHTFTKPPVIRDEDLSHGDVAH